MRVTVPCCYKKETKAQEGRGLVRARGTTWIRLQICGPETLDAALYLPRYTQLPGEGWGFSTPALVTGGQR